jgi:uncharacterized membrane protein YdbT with pleckstrin-like domain
MTLFITDIFILGVYIIPRYVIDLEVPNFLLEAKDESYAFIMLIQILCVSWLFLHWLSNHYSFQGNVLCQNKGILLKKTQEYIISEMLSIRCEQGLLGRVFNFGSIYITFANKEYQLKRITHPKKFAEFINERKKINK